MGPTIRFVCSIPINPSRTFVFIAPIFHPFSNFNFQLTFPSVPPSSMATSSSAVQPNADDKTPFEPSHMEEDDDELFNMLQEDWEAAVTFINDPYSSLLVFQFSSSYVTINGNEESCGSSFSDFGTSLMASVDVSSSFSFIPKYQVFPFTTY
ncbi:hypothetical protein QL285_095846 [Trifolium repens]|nr:hypothetical protein QL285_095846 [Trifolium repens]